jgi:hypothetical protein
MAAARIVDGGDASGAPAETVTQPRVAQPACRAQHIDRLGAFQSLRHNPILWFHWLRKGLIWRYEQKVLG